MMTAVGAAITALLETPSIPLRSDPILWGGITCIALVVNVLIIVGVVQVIAERQ